MFWRPPRNSGRLRTRKEVSLFLKGFWIVPQLYFSWWICRNMWYVYTYTKIRLQANSQYEKLEFCFYCSEYSLMHRNRAEQTIKIRYNKLIPCNGQERTVPPSSSITMTHKSPSQLLHSLIWPFPPCPHSTRKVLVAFHCSQPQDKHPQDRSRSLNDIT